MEVLAEFSIARRGLKVSEANAGQGALNPPSDTESLNASNTSVNRSLGSARDTPNLCRQDMPVAPNLAL